MPITFSSWDNASRALAETVGLTEGDFRYLTEEGGLTAEDIAHQLALLAQPGLSLRLDRACTLGDGIQVLLPAERERLAGIYRRYAQSGDVLRFIPASGAASRLFAAWDWYRHQKPAPSLAALQKLAEASPPNPEAKACLALLGELDRLPFHGDLLDVLNRENDSRDGIKITLKPAHVSEMLAAEGPERIIAALLAKPGLGLSDLPKALIPFHAYAHETRTALQEQVAETAGLAADQEGFCRLHLTVSPEHREAMEAAGRQAAEALSRQGKGRLHVGYSEQAPSTRTLSLSEGRLVRENGQPALRPGGHGALLGNLQAAGGALVFVKNIDNVVRAEALDQGLGWRSAMAGLLLETQKEIHALLHGLESEDKAEAGHATERAFAFLAKSFAMTAPSGMGHADSAAQARRALYRPLRVCGMVRNQGEPGGGPFWIRRDAGGLAEGLGMAATSPQIVEAAQVDGKDAAQAALLRQATHFNPVDFVAGLRDHRGRPYDLAAFSDAQAWFQAEKNKDGKRIKILERPGLWNGAMAHWLTLFVEIPLELFNPVKTIQDLLRPSHLG